jgi:RND superfamily putative drug exporter
VIGPAEQSLPVNLGAVFSPTGNAVRYFVVLNTDPLGSEGIEVLQRLRADMPAMLRAAGLAHAEASYAGDTALSAETVSKTEDDLQRLLPAATLIVFAILAVFLRALVAPVYLLLASLLALAASLGLTVYLFQGLLGHEDLTFYVPFAAAVLLLALGSDYNVYLVGRVWNEARRRTLREAIAVAGSRAAAAISVAAVVLSASFALLALVPLQPFRELAFAMSAGLLLDAFLVRTLLAPAMITLVGERSGWPGRSLSHRAVRLRRTRVGRS